MTPGFAARRRAEEFSSLVEATSTPDARAARHAEALELVGALRSVPLAEPRADFVSDLRHRLMAEADTVLTPTAARLTVAPRRPRRERRIAVAIGGFAVVSATTSMAMAAQSALPGDTLYPLKRAMENATTSIQVDEEAKGESLLEHASGRLDEVGELTQQRDANAQAVTDTLHAFTEQASSASELLIASYAAEGQRSDIEELRSFTAQSMEALSELETAVPDTARAALIEAAQVINAIDSQAIRLCPSCGDGGPQLLAIVPTSVDEVLDGLGSALGPLETGRAEGSGTTRPRGEPAAPAERPQPAPEQGDDAPKPAEVPVEQPDGVDAREGVPTDEGRGGVRPNDDDVLKDLTDRLSGGEKRPQTEQGDLADVLNDVVNGALGGVLGR